MACRHMELLGKDFFRDPAQLCDNWNIERDPRYLHPASKKRKELLWHNLPLLTEGSRRPRMNNGWMGRSDGAVHKTCLGFQEIQHCTALLDLLRICGRQKDLRQGSMMHVDILERDFVLNNIYVGTALLGMYAKCGALAEAHDVFDELPARDVVSWTALIDGYAEHGQGNEALNCFGQMRDEGLSPNVVTFVCILKACSNLGAAKKGEEIHADVCRYVQLGKNVVLGNALVDMYSKCGMLTKAQEVFDELPARDVVSWNALISGYAQHGLADEALYSFGQMRDEGISPDAITFVCSLKACSSIGAVEKGGEIHTQVRKQGIMEENILLGNALVDMYAKCGAIKEAQEVFEELPACDVVSWNALITGYTDNGMGDEALKLYVRMRDEGFSPDAVTYVCILKACSSTGASEKGEEIHAEVCKQGLVENFIALGIALVDMYAKCGTFPKAQEIFDELPARNVISWTALIAGYAQLGKADRVFDAFSRMIGECIKPDMVTFIVLLTACSHAGLVEEGQIYYNMMSTTYSIIPTLEHHICMVDLFGRAGHFDKAIRVIKKVAPSDCLLLWRALMGACRKWVNVEFGKLAFDHAVQLDEKDGGAYICMSNIYAAAGMQEEADKIEALRMKNGALKIPGHCWWTDASKSVHSFTVGEKSHPQSKTINAKLRDISKRLVLQGYSSRLHCISQAISDGEAGVLCGHSEKLAIACALINTCEGTPIRVTMNMRVCDDCHLATSLISKMEKRKIQVNDTNRIHIFENGRCSCEEYW